jgi:superfamily II DNA or RNA helicase
MIQLRPHQERIVTSMVTNPKGQVIVPTGGGKTLCMIKDAQREFNSGNKWGFLLKTVERKTIVVVSPRILLAQQHSDSFEEFLGIHPMLQRRVLHVHSGDTSHYSTTNADAIKQWDSKNYRFNKLIFTTYHSLHRIQESGINVDTVYFDEAHNSVQRHFFPATEFYSGLDNVRCYFFTATPKYNKSIETPSMDDKEVYGEEIERISARELIDNGYILPPKLFVKELEMTEAGRTPVSKEAVHLIETIDDSNVDKILICARRTAQIVNLLDETDFCKELASRGYSWMYITSKTGAYINGDKVDRETFFEVLNNWGKEDGKRFVVLHHSILSEGINVPGLEAALFMRNMNHIAISQTIGRVIRTGNDDKKFGLVAIPVYDRVGISTAKKVTAMVDTILA